MENLATRSIRDEEPSAFAFDTTEERHDPIDALARLGELDVFYEHACQTLWTYMRPEGRPSFTPSMLEDFVSWQALIGEAFAEEDRPLRYLVLGSRSPGVFCFGGDLDLFAKLITAGDRAGLVRYGQRCVEILFGNIHSLRLPILTIGLVEGAALGGGFEALLSFDHVIAERSATFGLPEIMFGLFPGMGAHALLSRKLGSAAANRLISSSKTYSAEEMHELGLVHELADDGQGLNATRAFIKTIEPQAPGAGRIAQGDEAQLESRIAGALRHHRDLGRRRASARIAGPQADEPPGVGADPPRDRTRLARIDEHDVDVFHRLDVDRRFPGDRDPVPRVCLDPVHPHGSAGRHHVEVPVGPRFVARALARPQRRRRYGRICADRQDGITTCPEPLAMGSNAPRRSAIGKLRCPHCGSPPRPVGHDPDLEDARRDGFAVIFGMTDAGARAHHLNAAGLGPPSIAERVLVRDRPVAHIGDDLHVGMRMRREAGLRRDRIVVPDADRTPAHPLRVVIAGETEMMPRVEPAMIGMAERSERAKVDHLPVSSQARWRDRARDQVSGTSSAPCPSAM